MAKGPGPWAEKQWLGYDQAVLDQLVEGCCRVSLAGLDSGIGGPGDMALELCLGFFRPMSS